MLTEDDVRRVIREELDRATPPAKQPGRAVINVKFDQPISSEEAKAIAAQAVGNLCAHLRANHTPRPEPATPRPRKPKTGQPWNAEAARKVWRMILESVYKHV